MTIRRRLFVKLGQGFAVDALGLFGIPLDKAGAVDHFAFGFGKGLALLGGHDAAQVVRRWPLASRTTCAAMMLRSLPVLLRQAGQAALAAAMAASRLGRPRLATSASFGAGGWVVHGKAAAALAPIGR
jgi:hypothetical protein